jgi:hypothetical protein
MSDIANASLWNSKNFLFSGMARKNLKKFLEFFEILAKTQKMLFFQKKNISFLFFLKSFLIKNIFQKKYFQKKFQKIFFEKFFGNIFFRKIFFQPKFWQFFSKKFFRKFFPKTDLFQTFFPFSNFS